MKILVFLALFVATIAAQNLDEKRKLGEIPRYDPSNLRDVSPDEKEAIHEAVRLLSMQHHIDPKERTEILKQLMTGEIDFQQALEKARAGGEPGIELDTKYRAKIDEISAKLKNRRSAHVEDLQKHREDMRERRKARMESRTEM